MDEALPTASVNGVSLFYVERGEGPPVILVHGGLGDYRDWGAMLPVFAPRFRTIAFSRRNAYPNPILSAELPCDPNTQAEDLAALIQSLSGSPAHLVADSYGAAVTLLCATRHPEVARSLVLDEPPLPSILESETDGPAIAREFVSLVEGQVLPAFDRGDSETAARTVIDYLEGSPGAWDQIPSSVRAEILRNSTALHRELRGGFPTVSDAALRSLSVPVLLIRGDVGPDVLHRCTEALAYRILQSKLLTLHGLTHGGLPQSEEYRKAVLAFLTEHS